MPYNCKLFVLSKVTWSYEVQSVGAVKYVDSISADDPPPKTNVLIMTQKHLMVRLPFWSFGEYEVLLHCHYSEVNFDS